jgi:hypothetical protein
VREGESTNAAAVVSALSVAPYGSSFCQHNTLCLNRRLIYILHQYTLPQPSSDLHSAEHTLPQPSSDQVEAGFRTGRDAESLKAVRHRAEPPTEIEARSFRVHTHVYSEELQGLATCRWIDMRVIKEHLSNRSIDR